MTLEPGIYDPSEAPWWVFTCRVEDLAPDFPPWTITRQWMGEAATAFGQHIANLAAAGTATARVNFTSTDGMTGHYEVTFEKRPTDTVYISSSGAR